MGKEKRQSPSTLLWFIRHKSYVPISEIRRRFYVDSEEGSFIEARGHRRAFVGLPIGTAQSLEKLYEQGKIGFEFSVEFDASVLIGVYPMNPSKEVINGNGFAGYSARRTYPVTDASQPVSLNGAAGYPGNGEPATNGDLHHSNGPATSENGDHLQEKQEAEETA